MSRIATLVALLALLFGLVVGAWLVPKTVQGQVPACGLGSEQVVIGWVAVEGGESLPIYGCASVGLWA